LPGGKGIVEKLKIELSIGEKGEMIERINLWNLKK